MQDLLVDFNKQDQYPTDEIYIVFNFTETEAVNDRFEAFGYEDSNFMGLTGGLFITQCIAFFSWIVSLLLKISAIRGRKYSICKKLGMKLP